MLDRRRFASRREKPELLGLSTLDTVTCALAGGIVLMMFMAFLTDPTAQVVQSDVRRTWEKGDSKGNDGKDPVPEDASSTKIEVRNVAVMFLDFPAPTKLKATIAKGCAFGSDRSLFELRSDKGHLRDSDTSHALVVWAGAADAACRGLEISIDYGSGAGIECRATLVSGAHYELRDFSPCRTSIALDSNQDQVFRFSRLQP